MARCTTCGADAGFMSTQCDACLGKERERLRAAAVQRVDVSAAADARARAAEAQRRDPAFPERAAAVVLTTEGTLPGRGIDEIVEVVTAECVLGMNAFIDLFAGMTDVFGGRSQEMQGALRRARRECLQELRAEAAALGADAVLGVRLDYSEISGQGKSMLFLVASGTAVRSSPRSAM